jgi:hypothetical protein
MKVIPTWPGGSVLHMVLMSWSKKTELFLDEIVQVKHNLLRNLENLLKSGKIFILKLVERSITEFS